MNRRQLKKDLKQLYTFPSPEKKQEFKYRFPTPTLSTFSFIKGQLGYIQKWVWISSFVIMGIILYGCRNMPEEALGIFPSLIPFLALMMLNESARSSVYHMEELELATRFSIKSVHFARMGAIAFCHGMILCILSIALGDTFFPSIGRIVYLYVPYFLTLCIGIHLLRKFHGKEYLCLGCSIFVSGLMYILYQLLPLIYEENLTILLQLAFAALIFYTCKELFLFYKQWEELSWN